MLFLIPEVVPGSVAFVARQVLGVSLQRSAAGHVVVAGGGGGGLEESGARQDGGCWCTRTGRGVAGQGAVLVLGGVLLQRIGRRRRCGGAEGVELHLLVLLLLMMMPAQLVILAHQMIIDHNAVVGIGAGRLELRFGVLLILAGIVLLQYVLAFHRLHHQPVTMSMSVALALVKEVVHVAKLQGAMLVALALIRGLGELLVLLRGL